jgi:folate-dependent phosphoribosylglycinamide formyltransferase PurN
VTRVVILAPIDNSPLSRPCAALCHAEPGVELAGVIVRKVMNPARIRAELRRDGIRLLRKVWRRVVLAEADDSAGDEESLHDIAARTGVGDVGLAAFCRREGIPYCSVKDHNDPESIDFLRECSPDVVVFTGGGIIRRNLIEVSGRGIFNAHMGVLPPYRGMDVVEWPILEDRLEDIGLGITLHFMDRGIDTGPIARIVHVPIRTGDSVERLRRRYERMMLEVMLDGVRSVRDGSLRLRPQHEHEGHQYYIMHPRLYAEVRRRLSRIEVSSEA